MATTLAELRAKRDGVVDADLVELRLDGLDASELNVAGALADRKRPVVVTCRARWEGGQFAGAEDDRLRVLADAARQGAEYVDVEWRADWSRVAAARPAAMVLSHHDFDGIPLDLAERVREMRSTGASLIKIAVTANRLRDCLTLKDAVRGETTQIVIAMGDAGCLTRVLPAHFASSWTYAGTVAAGQFSASELRHRYRVGETTSATRVFGIAGAPLGHSASPAMHNAAFASGAIDAVYVPFATADADELIAVADAIGAEGLSVTAPLKSTLMAHCQADGDARAIGAVNTLRRGAHGWSGRNFDAAAFLDPIDRRDLMPKIRRAVVIGAGGAARAAAWALQSRGVSVAIAARNSANGAVLAASLGASVAAWPPASGWDLLVNATPAGTWPHVEDAPVGRASISGPLVYDLIYNPRETTLMSWAREAGATTIGGLEMLVSQACRQFEWWMDRPADRAIFARAAAVFVDETQGQARRG